uniref:PH domain-containing protein n=1 Tax=Hyaloperonospora arabidopsidis (strain Emoy2) TaxID=559515 RepID=M4BVI6_HYAAE
MATSGALLHSCTVYLYLYDAASGSYTQQTEAAVGCALLGGDRERPSAFSLLLYDAQKSPLLQVLLTPSTRFLPQTSNYVNFYDSQSKQYYAMRFKDAANSEEFLWAVALIKAQVLVHSATSFERQKRRVVLVDDVAIGREDAEALGAGDVAGVTLKKWHGTVAERDQFFSANPLDIRSRQTTDATIGNDVKRIKLVEEIEDGEMDPFVVVLATKALIGMHKMAKRVVTVTFPDTQKWVIAEVELVKVKKNTRSSADLTPTPSKDEYVRAPITAASGEMEEQTLKEHDELVKRMAMLSRIGSQTSGMMASVQTKVHSRQTSIGDTEVMPQQASFSGHQSTEPPAGYVPVLLAGLQLPGQRPGSFRNLRNDLEVAKPSDSSSPLRAKSVTVPTFNLLKQQSTSPRVDVDGGTILSSSLSSDLERLMKKQSDLARLHAELEQSKRKLQADDTSVDVSAAQRPHLSTEEVNHSVGLTEHKLAHEKQAPSFAPTSFPSMGFHALSAGTSSSYGTTTDKWSPANLDIVPSFPPSMFNPQTLGAPASPTPFSSSLTPYTNRSFPSYPSTPGVSGSGSSPDVENGIFRLQRSSTSIESMLHDLQSKMDRLLNVQNSMKASSYAGNARKYGGSVPFSSVAFSSSSSSSSSMLLKNIEKALAQREQLQEANARLEDANGELESSVEDLQNQHESLQMENRALLDKLQSGNHLQQEKFGVELRSVQAKLSQSQEQMLAYQEENFRLRAELDAKDDKLVKEKAKLQEDVQKQYGTLRRQAEEEVRQGLVDSIDKMATENAALVAQVNEYSAQKNQWAHERDLMNKRLSEAQSQQVQLQDDSVKSQSAQNSRVQELLARLEQLEAELKGLEQQADQYRFEAQHLEELLVSKEHEMAELQSARNDREYAALSGLFKEFMNDIYFHFQDAFDEDTEFTGKEIVMAIRKILKQNTMDILAKLEEFYQQEVQHRQ